jgi:hypothetical protein
VGGQRQPHQHDGRRLMTHARDRGHHRSFATTATTTPFPPDPSSPGSKATARDHNASSLPTIRAPRSLASPSMPLAGGIHGIRRIDPSTSAFPTSPPNHLGPTSLHGVPHRPLAYRVRKPLKSNNVTIVGAEAKPQAQPHCTSNYKSKGVSSSNRGR